MTDRERGLYRWLFGFLILSIALAVVMTYLASRNDAVWANLIALVNALPLIPARYWAQGSDFPDLAAIYFFWSWPVLPASLAAFATRFWTPGENTFIDRSAPNFELKFGLASLLMFALGLGMLWAMDGDEVMGVSIGTQLPNLLVFGWIPFAIGGCVAGLGVIGLRRTFALDK